MGEQFDLVELDLSLNIVLPPGVELLVALPVGASILHIKEVSSKGLLVDDVLRTVGSSLIQPMHDFFRWERKTYVRMLRMILNISFRILESIEENICDKCSRATSTTRRFGHVDASVQVDEMETASKATLGYQTQTTSLPSIQPVATYAIINSTHQDRGMREKGEF